MGKVKSIKICRHKGEDRELVNKAYVIENYGLREDIKGGKGNRQVSILSQDSIKRIESQQSQGLCTGRFVENLTIENIDLFKYPCGTKFSLGEVVLEISEIGKKCFKQCRILEEGDKCVLHRECIFAKVIKSGWIKLGDDLKII